tara:strand:+ start:812 stop:1129 length:318 start_codon:yes stop_codon:yes gene_type:complete
MKQQGGIKMQDTGSWCVNCNQEEIAHELEVGKTFGHFDYSYLWCPDNSGNEFERDEIRYKKYIADMVLPNTQDSEEICEDEECTPLAQCNICYTGSESGYKEKRI